MAAMPAPDNNAATEVKPTGSGWTMANIGVMSAQQV